MLNYRSGLRGTLWGDITSHSYFLTRKNTGLVQHGGVTIAAHNVHTVSPDDITKLQHRTWQNDDNRWFVSKTTAALIVAA